MKWLIIILILSVASACDSSGVKDGLTYEQYLEAAKQYEANGDNKRAINAYKEALKIKPMDSNTHLTLGRIYNEEYWKTYKDAHNKYVYDRLSKVDKGQSKDLLQELEDYGLDVKLKESAMHEYKVAVKYDPWNWEARYYIAVDCLNNNKYKEAIDEGSKAIEINPKYTNSYIIVGDACLKLGYYVSAMEYYTKLYKVNADKEYYYYSIGRVNCKNNNLKVSYEMLDKLKELHSTYREKLWLYIYEPKSR